MSYEKLELEYLGNLPEISNKSDYKYQMVLIRRTVFKMLYESRYKEITLSDILEHLNSNGIFVGAKTLYNNYVSTFVRKGIIIEKKHRGRVDYVFRWNLSEDD